MSLQTDQFITERDVYTVSRLNREVRTMLEGFPLLWIEAEISNFSCPASGHWYFTLKDEASQVRGAMFRNRNRLLRFKPENGTQVLVRARIGLYEARGEYQIIIEHMEEAGDGALRQAFEQLKQKLNNEGLFDTAHKQNLPTHPQTVGIITSATGAAVQDILSTLARRFPSLPIIVYPVAVQGQGAAEEICNMIKLVEQRHECDVLILARGGGSLEDLWAFNDETLARTIYQCQIPIVSGIGHEIDFTIADFVADHRAPTPTAAAELISPDQYTLLTRLQQLEAQLSSGISGKLQANQQRIEWLHKRLPHPARKLQDIAQRLDESEQRIQMALTHSLRHTENKVSLLFNRLQQQQPLHRLRELEKRQQQLSYRLFTTTKYQLEKQQKHLEHLAHNLNAVSPLSTLSRGYAIVTTDKNDLVQSASDLRQGQTIHTRLKTGNIVSRVEKTSS
ncbi:MAG: exodeoxyribonuclease VII large subunit [Gammaproteobacteria bacterium]|nr:exodeoxyribonuclease VII large subunit [Gammaproteobacteria bacterium]